MIKPFTRFLALLLAVLLCVPSDLFAQQDNDTPTYPSMTCEKDTKLDTCWRNAADNKESDPAKALFYYNLSCDFGHQPWGCYEAGKLYLHNAELQDYTKAYQRFDAVCTGADVGAGPYACKFLGWMHLTGVGVKEDSKLAANLLSKACFSHNVLTTDPEGCKLLGDGFLKGQFDNVIKAEKIPKDARPTYMAYLAYSRACLDDAKDVCITAAELLAKEQEKKAGWIEICSYRAPTGFMCVDIPVLAREYEVTRKLERNLISQYHEFTQYPLSGQ